MTIDVHGHVTPPELLKRFPMPPSLGDIDGMVERKAALGITTTVVGSPVGAGTMLPAPGIDNYAQSADSLASFHEWVAETVREKAGALTGYVYVNPFATDDVARAAELLRYDEFTGLIVNTSVRGEFLDDERGDEFFAMAQETGAPVLLHPPAVPVAASSMKKVGAIEHVVRPCDITMGVAAILLAGRLRTYPGLKLIAPNAGGALALLAEKLDMAQRRDQIEGPPLSAQLRQIYVDTATPSLPALRAAVEVFGPDRMLFGTDSPPLATPLDAALASVDALGLSDEDRAKVLGGNAVSLFGLGPAELRRAS
ncbi:MAG: amidohydrolase family protein [Actinophytocola sp.]|uniref:amidohydrolase family protein n=1 Tax=Actinophytocola sp. TaxID=1872138 RepID=UPI001327C18C|nr:amidohydrolase family protein [Actinophytocola sp.]MPZ81820.1 amidohydrolase family protein [Actinophytocola sp.]